MYVVVVSFVDVVQVIGCSDDFGVGWIVWVLYVFVQVVYVGIGVVEQVQQCVDDFVEIVWWYVGGYVYGNVGGVVEQQVWELCWYLGWFLQGVVEVWCLVGGVLVQFVQQYFGDWGQFGFGVMYCCE